MAEFRLREYQPDPKDPLAPEHLLVSQWMAESAAVLEAAGPHSWYREVRLKQTETGKKILDFDAEQSRRIACAAVQHVKHWDREAAEIRNAGKTEFERWNPHMRPEWSEVWGRRRRAGELVCALMRRTLPFTEVDLVELLDWIGVQEPLYVHQTPVVAIARAVERFHKNETLTARLKTSMRVAAAKLRTDRKKDANRAATTLEQLFREVKSGLPERSRDKVRPVAPGPAGNPAVLRDLKVSLKMFPADEPPVATGEIGPDHFPLRADSPLGEEHILLTELFEEVAGTPQYSSPEFSDCRAGRQIVKASDIERGKYLLAACERTLFGLMRSVDYGDSGSWQAHSTAAACIGSIIDLSCSFDRAALFDLLLYFSVRPLLSRQVAGRCLKSIRAQADDSTLTDGERFVLSLLRTSVIDGPPFGAPSEIVTELSELIGDSECFVLMPTEHWSIGVNHDIASLSSSRQVAWGELLRHCVTATASRPAEKWLKTGRQLLKPIGTKAVRGAFLRWFGRVPAGRATPRIPVYRGDTRTGSDVIQEENALVLRGLLWLAPLLAGEDEMTRAISVVGQSAYKKVPGVGPRAVKVGNAAVYPLSEIHSPAAVGHLAMLKARVKFGTAQKEVEKAFNVAAEALQLPRDQIEEMGVPTYGMEDVGVLLESFGEAVVELCVDGREVTQRWTSGGKSVKSAPASVKRDHKDELKELQAAVKDIAAMLPVQSERLDGMFLLQKRWPAEIWRERYLDHPLVGTLARRLIWLRGDTVFAWREGNLRDPGGKTVALRPTDEVSLWHPIDRPVDEVLAWRNWLEHNNVRQPFKQAHREVYRLTDAERRTNTYSNRFAGHILRQHQFHALCAARGWKNKLRLMVDDSYPPARRELPNWGLRAEFWIDGAGDNYGTDTNDSGAFLRVATDQVRFYRTGAAPHSAYAGTGGYVTLAGGPGQGGINEPVALEEIPPLVLSEILRDVDLFVGVASVGNDPTWQDGGPEGRYRDYWHSYSFGELAETARTRRAVLESLLPKLNKLKERWTLAERFLVIRGDLRTYKIHLGSGNILMEPNDQYLCIVPDRSSRPTETIFLPFEGDATLSVILSKAFLLAADTKITDSAITRQIKR
jgi:hypothetical protein